MALYSMLLLNLTLGPGGHPYPLAVRQVKTQASSPGSAISTRHLGQASDFPCSEETRPRLTADSLGWKPLSLLTATVVLLGAAQSWPILASPLPCGSCGEGPGPYPLLSSWGQWLRGVTEQFVGTRVTGTVRPPSPRPVLGLGQTSAPSPEGKGDPLSRCLVFHINSSCSN